MPETLKFEIALAAGRRGAIGLALAGFVLTGCSGTDGVDDAAQPQRNAPVTAAAEGARSVVLITLDGLRQDHVSLFGYERQTTPNLDRLGPRARLYRDVIPTSGSTKASLTSLFTAIDYRYHHIFQHTQKLPEDYVTLAEAFRDAGYITAAVTATPMLSAQLGYGQGFLIYEDFAREPGSLDYVRAERVADRMLEILARIDERDVDAPFFLYAHFEEPHPPWFSPSPWPADDPGATYETQPFDIGCTFVPEPERFRAVTPAERGEWIDKYDGAILQADRQIGRVLDWLDARGRTDRTIVAVTTDHGYDLLDKYAFGHGYGISDEIVRTFLILADGANETPPPPGAVQARIFDIGPTLLALNGIAPPPTWEGVDLVGEPERLPRFAYSVDSGVTAVRSLDWKLVHVDFAGARPKPDYVPEFGFMLFDLTNDPDELRDVKELHPEVFHELRAAYDRFQVDREREFVLGTTEPLSDENEERLRSLGYIN